MPLDFTQVGNGKEDRKPKTEIFEDEAARIEDEKLLGAQNEIKTETESDDMQKRSPEVLDPIGDKKEISTIIDQWDIDKAKAKFAGYSRQLDKVKQSAENLVVKDEKSAKESIEMVAQADRLFKTLDKKRKEIIEKPDKFVRSFNAFVKPFKDQLSSIIAEGKRKFGAYDYNLKLQKKIDDKKAQDEIDERQTELDKVAEKAGVDKVILPKMVTPKKQEPFRSESGSASVGTDWDFEVIDLKEVPKHWMCVDQSKVKIAIKGGIRDIPGIRIFEKPKVRFRGQF